MIQVGMPKKYWGESVHTATYLHNCTPCAALEGKTTPYKRWFGCKPHFSHLRVFGCAGYAYIPSGKCRKLDNKAQMLRMVGYSSGTHGYRLLDQKTEGVVYRRDIVFDESSFTIQKCVDGVTPAEYYIPIPSRLMTKATGPVPPQTPPANWLFNQCWNRTRNRK